MAGAQEPPDRWGARFRAHRAMSMMIAAVGLSLSALIVREAWRGVGFDDPVIVASPVLAVTILVAGTVGALVTYLSGVPSAMSRTYADFWSTGKVGRVVAELALSACATLAIGIGLVVLVGAPAD